MDFPRTCGAYNVVSGIFPSINWSGKPNNFRRPPFPIPKQLIQHNPAITIHTYQTRQTLANSFLCKFLVSIWIFSWSFTFNLYLYGFRCFCHSFGWCIVWFVWLYGYMTMCVLARIELSFFCLAAEIVLYGKMQFVQLAKATNNNRLSILCYILKVKSLSIFAAFAVAVLLFCSCCFTLWNLHICAQLLFSISPVLFFTCRCCCLLLH